ncbi:MAG: cell wall hydrolase [Lachnospiraceae bacterium]|nr:cell wall hydrolase [Lachnospiraceae bacterium]
MKYEWRRCEIKKELFCGQRYLLYVGLFYCICCMAIASVIGIKGTRIASAGYGQGEKYSTVEKNSEVYTDKKAQIQGMYTLPIETSGQRMVSYEMIQKERIIELSEEDYQNLLKIVESEAGGEDIEGKMLVANVVINRVKSTLFPNNVTDVIFQKEQGVSQFSPTSDGRIYQVSASEDTINAVNRALLGENNAKGALYFAARDYADPMRMQWFDTHLTFLFKHGGHEFFY